MCRNVASWWNRDCRVVQVSFRVMHGMAESRLSRDCSDVQVSFYVKHGMVESLFSTDCSNAHVNKRQKNCIICNKCIKWFWSCLPL